MLSDSEDVEAFDRFYPLEVPDVGAVVARKPMPHSIASLAMAANSKIPVQSRTDYLVLFVQNHLAPGEMERIYVEMIQGSLPVDSIELISREIATWGTARPTLPSSH